MRRMRCRPLPATALWPAVTVNVSNIFPLAENLTQNGMNVKVDGNQEMLFRPVIHLYGAKNKTLDGKVIEVRVWLAINCG